MKLPHQLSYRTAPSKVGFNAVRVPSAVSILLGCVAVTASAQQTLPPASTEKPKFTVAGVRAIVDAQKLPPVVGADGWTTFRDRDQLFWRFAPEGSDAFPALVQGIPVVNDDGDLHFRMTQLCEASPDVCQALRSTLPQLAATALASFRESIEGHKTFLASEPHACDAKYPIEERRRGIEGVTKMLAFYTSDGRARRIVITESSGSENLDAQAARCAIAATDVSPLKPKPGEAPFVNAWLPLSIRWKLN